MKAFLKVLLISLFTIGTVSGCDLYQGNGIKPSKKHITRSYQVNFFNRIDVNTVASVNYEQSKGDTVSVKIYGPENIVNLLEVNVKDTILRIKTKTKVNFNKTNLKINITSPQLKGLYFKGVGDVNIKEALNGDVLELENKGVGDINITNFIGNKISIESSGVGNIKIGGVTKEAHLSSKGVGDIKALELKANKVDANAKGVGNIECYAVEAIHAEAKGIGSIEYKGNPTIKSLNKKGIGSISHK